MVESDGVLWTTYRFFGPCRGLGRAVDVEGQAVLRNGEDLKLFVENESAVAHFHNILKAPACSQGEIPGPAISSTRPGVPPGPLAHLLRGGVTHIGGLMLPSLTPSQGCGGSGAENRRGPTGA